MFKKSVFLLLAVILVLPATAMAAEGIMEKIEFNANAGLSMPVGDASDCFNIGICLGIDGFVPYNDNVLFGGRIAYNRWGVDDGGWTGTNINGSGSVMEFLPQVRYLFTRGDSARNTNTFYGQAGLGFYRFSFDVDVGSYDIDDCDIDLGLSLGGGIIIHQSESKTWEIRPALNIIFDNGSTKYFTISGGFSF